MPITRDDVIRWLTLYSRKLAEQKEYLTELDSAIGDADHGANMDRGFQAVAARLAAPGESDIAAVLKTTGMTLVSSVGGASGPLYGTMFLEMARAASGKPQLSLEDWAAILQAGLNGVVRRGKAAAGDKTMVDALEPAVKSVEESVAIKSDWSTALRRSADAAEQGMKRTIPIVARKGRASYLGERSAGHQDPGATSSFYLIQCAAQAWAELES